MGMQGMNNMPMNNFGMNNNMFMNNNGMNNMGINGMGMPGMNNMKMNNIGMQGMNNMNMNNINNMNNMYNMNKMNNMNNMMNNNNNTQSLNDTQKHFMQVPFKYFGDSRFPNGVDFLVQGRGDMTIEQLIKNFRTKLADDKVIIRDYLLNKTLPLNIHSQQTVDQMGINNNTPIIATKQN